MLFFKAAFDSLPILHSFNKYYQAKIRRSVMVFAGIEIPLIIKIAKAAYTAWLRIGHCGGDAGFQRNSMVRH
jgi:hypothetical protein